jgi:hypothetical protein
MGGRRKKPLTLADIPRRDGMQTGERILELEISRPVRAAGKSV